MREAFDLEAAVAAGVIGEDQAVAIRNHEAALRGMPAASEEALRLTSGFADIMAALGLFLVLFVAFMAVGKVFWLVPFMAIGIWLAARYFTIRRRMLASSFVLFIFFVLTIAGGLASLVEMNGSGGIVALIARKSPAIAIIGAVGAVACWLYWRRFRLPIVVAFIAVAVVQCLNGLIGTLFPAFAMGAFEWINGLWGVALFAFAMSWDVTDIRRETDRSEVAFWLHCLAGFYLTRTAFTVMLGVSPFANDTWFTHTAPAANGGLLAIMVLAMYSVFCCTALIIDRRSLVVSSLAYAAPALAALLNSSGSPEALGVSVMAAGLFLVALSVNWTAWRRRLLARLPASIRSQVPRPDLVQPGRRPSRRHLPLRPRDVAGQEAPILR